jgi:hypothetical protein
MRQTSEKVGRQYPDLLRSLQLQVLHHHSTPILLLIDAVDECIVSDIAKTKYFLQALDIEARDLAHVCLSSRRYPNISIKGAIEIYIENSNPHRQCIEKYAVTTLQDESRAALDEIVRNSPGIFMWIPSSSH